MKQRSIRNDMFKLALAMILVLTVSQGVAGNARKLLRQGNDALKAEKYDEALDAYGKAALEAPESPSLIYNEGIVWYRQGDFVQAREKFAKAGMSARQSRVPDRALEARCEQAVGNCWFREGQRQQDSDLKKSVESFVSSIAAYDRALEIDPENQVTIENRKSARLLLKKIMAELAARQKAQQEQQKQQEELARQLAELAERQEQAADQSKAAAATPTPQEKFTEMQENQRAISTDTTTLAEKFQAMTPPPASPGQSQDSPPDSSAAQDILEEMTQAQEAQQQAQPPLDQNAPAQAEPLQKQAAQHLRNALEKMKQQQEQQQQQQQQQQEGQGEQQQQQQEKSDDGEQKSDDESKEDKQSAQSDESDEPEGEQKEQQVAREVDDNEAKDILNQEKTDKQRRQGNINRGYRPVPKDW